MSSGLLLSPIAIKYIRHIPKDKLLIVFKKFIPVFINDLLQQTDKIFKKPPYNLIETIKLYTEETELKKIRDELDNEIKQITKTINLKTFDKKVYNNILIKNNLSFSKNI